ncbi:hypothetical protein PNOK_0248200 [Pyrrhoderma noxium]|uniref:EthD domain-containing protein n=1 Tax=Pyrrhoderma noxium TaxID=2282107 RepID=A0A286UST4_9AGAM|nr:hypothetical protein PNOK_0248200 [Pyrrhoderma noxium]
MSGKVLLFVLAEVGDKLSESEFNDWYDNEHIPLRTVLSGFHTATRLIQADNRKPTWAAIYDISDIDFLKSDAYTNLARTRSPREADLLGRIGLLDRRIYTLNESGPTTISPEFAGHTNGMALLPISFDVPPDFEAEFDRWYNEEHIALLSKVPGWLRTRRFILADSGVTGILKERGYNRYPRIQVSYVNSLENQSLSHPDLLVRSIHIMYYNGSCKEVIR